VLTRRNESILAVILITLAALARLGPIASGLPYISYVDEGHVLHPAIGILKAKSFDSSIYTYPPLTSYLTAAAVKIYAPFYRLVHHHSFRKDLPSNDDFQSDLGERYDLITPPEIIWLGRFVVACLSVGIVFCAGALGKLLGGSRAGLIAMLFTGLCPALISRGSIVIIDTVATFFALMVLYFCQRLRIVALSGGAMWRIAAFAGIAAGLACGAKYTVGAVFVAVLITIATLPGPPRPKVILIMITTAGLCAGIVIGVPAALLHPTKIIAELRAQGAFYQTIRSEQNYWRAALSAQEIGLPLIIAGLAGIIWMCRNRATRSIALSWLGFGLLLLSAVVWPSFQPFRNVLSLVPLLCIAAALFSEQARRYLEQRETRYASQLAVALVLFLVCSSAWSSVRYLATRITHTDSRIEAIDWLEQHAPKDALVLGIRELAILPAEWKRIPAKSLIVSWSQAADALQQQRFDYVVTGEFDLRYAQDPAGWSSSRDRWRLINSTMPAVARFGAVPTPVVPYLWRTNDELVFILKPEAR
jgi:hypothetical protein